MARSIRMAPVSPAGRTLGVYYAAAEISTAVAEMAFFTACSSMWNRPRRRCLPTRQNTPPFSARIATEQSLDLTEPPLVRDREAWEHPTAYAACQDLADTGASRRHRAILYRSVRDPAGGKNLALLSPGLSR